MIMSIDFSIPKWYLFRYRSGKSKDTQEKRIQAINIVEAREKFNKLHRDGLLYPPLSAYLPITIQSIVCDF